MIFQGAATGSSTSSRAGLRKDEEAPRCATATTDGEETEPQRAVPRAGEGTPKWDTDLKDGDKSDEMQLEMDEDESKQLKL